MMRQTFIGCLPNYGLGKENKIGGFMKLLPLATLLLITSVSGQQDGSETITDAVRDSIAKAKDYYTSSMYEKSKKILIELLYTDEGKRAEEDIRFHLGLASLMEEKHQAVRYHWHIIVKNYPTSERAKQINRYLSTVGQVDYEQSLADEEYVVFNKQLALGRYFWSPIYPDYKLQWSELKEPLKAIEYYGDLLQEYDEPDKKFKLASNIFLIYGGFNDNSFGYSHGTKGHQYSMANMLKIMEENITDENDINYLRFVEANYLMAVTISGSTIFSGKMKVNKDSKVYFEKVVELTENYPFSLYRVFSELWLTRAK